MATTIEGRILELIRDGAETAADLEVDLNFALTKHRISAHLSNLAADGRIRKVGERHTHGKSRPLNCYTITDGARDEA